MEREELRQESAIITDQEAEKLLHEWNRTKIDYPRDKCVHHLFEEQVMRSPDSIAVVYEHEHATYAELNAKANRLAHYLVKKGVKEESIVAVFLERGIDMLVGLLAISKVGATYLPLDPIYPKVRIEMVLNDARPLVCLTQKSLTDHLPQSATKFILIDEKEKYVTESADNLSYGKPLTPLYIIFTSGSTGKPKGVMIEQRSLHNLVLGLSNEVYGDRNGHLNIALISPFVFDASVKQVFTSLLNGHCLDIVSEEIKTNGRKLIQFYEEHRIEVTDGTPSHLEIILEELKADKNRYLPGIFLIGGEQLIIQTVRKSVVMRSCDEILHIAQRIKRQGVIVAAGGDELELAGLVIDLLGILARRKGDLGTARTHLEHSLAVVDAAESGAMPQLELDPSLRIAILNTLALVLADEGDRERAISLTEDALARCTRQGDRHRQAALENNLADLLQETGHPAEAMEHLKRAVTLFVEIGGRPGELEPEIWKLVEW